MTHTWIVRAALVVAGAMCIACGGGVEAPNAMNLDGTWTRGDEVPGSSEQWSLTVNGSSVVGTGSWSGEACCGGTLSIAGSIGRDSIHVDATLTIVQGTPRAGFHEHFDGALISSGTLRGTLTVDGGTSATIEMHR